MNTFGDQELSLYRKRRTRREAHRKWKAKLKLIPGKYEEFAQKRREYHRAWVKKHPEKGKEYSLRWLNTGGRAKRRAVYRKRYSENIEEMRKQKREEMRKGIAKLRKDPVKWAAYLVKRRAWDRKKYRRTMANPVRAQKLRDREKINRDRRRAQKKV